MSRDPDALLTAAEVAELLRVTPDYVYALSRRGVLPTVRLGRARRYRRESVLAWIAEVEASGHTGGGNMNGRGGARTPPGPAREG